jgi:hypothetical protein
MAEVKSTEVYGVLEQELSPVLKPFGFKRGNSFLSWFRVNNGMYTVLWCQVSRDGWDDYAGSQFTVEFQRSSESEAGSLSRWRMRVAKLLSEDEREEVWRIQDSVIASLRRPPRNHPTFSVSPEVAKWYLAKFDKPSRQYDQGDDIWFRYAKAEHVAVWATLLARLMPRCVESIEEDSSATDS